MFETGGDTLESQDVISTSELTLFNEGYAVILHSRPFLLIQFGVEDIQDCPPDRLEEIGDRLTNIILSAAEFLGGLGYNALCAEMHGDCMLVIPSIKVDKLREGLDIHDLEPYSTVVPLSGREDDEETMV